MTANQKDRFLIWDQKISTKFANWVLICKSLSNQRRPYQIILFEINIFIWRPNNFICLLLILFRQINNVSCLHQIVLPTLELVFLFYCYLLSVSILPVQSYPTYYSSALAHIGLSSKQEDPHNNQQDEYSAQSKHNNNQQDKYNTMH